MIKSVLITGANAGLGKESARQLANKEGIEKIYLGCRNLKKAEAAKAELEQATGKKIFEIIQIDVSDVASVKAAVRKLNKPIDALVMNAGGMGGNQPFKTTSSGMIQMMAVNLLGHVVLAEELLSANKIKQVAIYAGSEASRGVPMMGMKRPKLASSSVEEFKSILDGSYFKKKDGMVAYVHVKYVAAFWMSALARKYSAVKIVTVSPGGTSGTNVMEDLPQPMKFMFKTFGSRLMPMMGMMHELPKGAKRYVDVLYEDEYKTGRFYASKAPVLVGELVDQATIFSDFKNQTYQDNAYKALQSFVK